MKIYKARGKDHWTLVTIQRAQLSSEAEEPEQEIETAPVDEVASVFGERAHVRGSSPAGAGPTRLVDRPGLYRGCPGRTPRGTLDLARRRARGNPGNLSRSVTRQLHADR